MAEKTESSIVIDASPAAVMAVIANLAAYPEWSDGITSVEVLSRYEEDDRPADARFTVDSGMIKDTYELEYDWEGVESVSWTLTKGEMLTALDGSYLLSDNGDGSTSVAYRLAVDVKMPMIGMLKRKAEKVIIDTALKGLKKRVEATSTSHS
jgi:ribosome-associated toxin RatA of RatAB toxin-antitoxin module